MNYSLSGLYGIPKNVCVITGAAGGIATEIAHGMGRIDAKLVLVDIDERRIRALKVHLDRKGINSIAIPTDVTKKESVSKMVKEAIDHFGRIDALVNCAGVSYLADAVSFEESRWDWVINVNLKGTFLCCQAVGEHMLKRKSGKIVNFSSVRGLQGRAGDLAYAPSKGAINLLTKSLAIEWASHNINVNAIAPTFTLTDINKDLLKNPMTRKQVLSRIPKGRLCKPEYIVGPTIFLCSPSAEFITGHVLYVDGGWTAS